VPMCYWRR